MNKRPDPLARFITFVLAAWLVMAAVEHFDPQDEQTTLDYDAP